MLKQTKIQMSIKELVKGFRDNSNNGGSVVGYGGRLDIRPEFQREFIYNEHEQQLVIDTILHGWNLGVFTWSDDGAGYELLDGQQRTMSICNFILGNVDYEYPDGTVLHFPACTDVATIDQIYDYKIDVIVCSGTANERLGWFKRVNIAGKPLTEQEMLNASYTGPWLYDAKLFFSNPVITKGSTIFKYMKGDPLRQDYLHTVLDWISEGEVQGYMHDHFTDPNAKELIDYFNDVMKWVNTIIANNHGEKCFSDLKGLPWGEYYNKYSADHTKDISNDFKELYYNPEVTNTKGIIEYLLSDDEKFLNRRTFDLSTRREAYFNQGEKCADCDAPVDFDKLEAHHNIPWNRGGRTTLSNCVLLCHDCHAKRHGQ